MVENEFSPHSANPDPILKDLANRQMPALKGYVSTEIKTARDDEHVLSIGAGRMSR